MKNKLYTLVLALAVSLNLFSSEIHFNVDEQKGLIVTIETQRLHLRSVQPTTADYDRIADLFSNEKAMKKFGTGEPRDKDRSSRRVTNWANRWFTQDPYAGFVVFKKGQDSDTDALLGIISLGHSKEPGVSELMYLFDPEYKGNGYGLEAATALVQEYALATLKEGCTLDEKPLERIIATARVDNVPSNEILKKLGFELVETKETYGAMRNHYCLSLQGL